MRDESRSNHVQVIALDNTPIVYVKQRGPASRLDGDDCVTAERNALTCLKDVDLVPKLIKVRDSDAVWVQAVPGADLSKLRGQVGELAAICFRWGAAVAQLHCYRATPEPVPTAPRPWALQPDNLPFSMRGAETGSAFALVLDALRDESALSAAADRANRGWGASAWIHGDLSATNVIVTSTADNAMIRFVDLEAAGLGDPGWDVATALDTLAWLAPSWNAPTEPLVERFLDGISHDMSVVENICDRVAVMYLGKIVEVADTAELYGNPQHPYTEALLSAVPRPDPRLRGSGRRIRLSDDFPDPADPPSGCFFHTRCRYADTDDCVHRRPELRSVAGGHLVACHHAERLELAAATVPVDDSRTLSP